MSLWVYPVRDSLGFLYLDGCLGVLSMLGKFLTIISNIFSYPFFFFSSSVTPIIQMLVCLILSQRFLRLSSILFSLFSLLCSSAFIYIILSSSSLIYSSASVILLLIPSAVFLIPVIVLFITICLFFVFSRSLLMFLVFSPFYFLYFETSLLSLL